MSRYGNGLEGGTFSLLAVTKKDTNPKQSDTFPPPQNATSPVLAYFYPLDYPQKVQEWCSKRCKLWGDDDTVKHIAGIQIGTNQPFLLLV